MTPTLEQTVALMMKAHEGQFDKIGLPYWYHPYRVMKRTQSSDLQTLFIALLHDVVEDSHKTLDEPITLETLESFGYDQIVLDGVELVTSDKKLSYKKNMEKLVNSRNERAILVKLADNADNSSPSRINCLEEKEAKRLQAKYTKARNILIPALPTELSSTILVGDYILSPVEQFLLSPIIKR